MSPLEKLDLACPMSAVHQHVIFRFLTQPCLSNHMQLKGSLKIDLRSIGRSVEILVNGHVCEIIKSTTGLLQ